MPAAGRSREHAEYVLGTSDHELGRLELQDRVWRDVTRELLLGAGPLAGARCLDAGAGPGFASELLLELCGPGGEVLALDESPRWIGEIERRARQKGLARLRAMQGKLETAELEPGSFDLVFMRWVLSFVADPAQVVARMSALLRPGGRLVIQDYNHEGVSLFPESKGFRAAVRATRALYRSRGGDAFVMGRITGMLRAAGLELTLLQPRALAGGPGSPAFTWADAFFPHHSAAMVEQGLMTPAERERFLLEWDEHRRDPDALFYSPCVVGAIAHRPEERR